MCFDNMRSMNPWKIFLSTDKKYSYFVTYHLRLPVTMTWQHRKYRFWTKKQTERKCICSWCNLMVRPQVFSVTCTQIRQVWARHRPKNLLQHSREADHLSAASITHDVWEGPGGPTAAGSAGIKTTAVFLQRRRSSFPSLSLLQSARVKQTILSSPSSHYGSKGSLLGNMAYLISAYRSRWAANVCSKSLFFYFFPNLEHCLKRAQWKSLMKTWQELKRLYITLHMNVTRAFNLRH